MSGTSIFFGPFYFEAALVITNLNFKLNLKVSAFYLEKQKSFIPKKKKIWAVPPRYIQKMALAVLIFQKVLICISNHMYSACMYLYLILDHDSVNKEPEFLL